MQKLIRRSTGSWKLWEGQEKAVPAGRKIESKRRAQVWRKKISYLGGSRHSLGCLLYRPCPQPGPWRRLQKKPRPIDAKAPPRTCGPAPRPGPRLRPQWGAVQGQVVPDPEACSSSQGAAVCPPVPRFLLRPRPCPQATASSPVGPYDTPESSGGRSLRRERAGPAGVEALLPRNADCDPAPALGRCRETSVDALAGAWAGQ